MMEQWRAVPGFEGFYEVSDQGRVRSVTRTILVNKPGCRPYELTFQGRTLRPGFSNGYMHVTLWKRGASSQHNVCWLVLRAFVGERPSRMQACHGNGVSTDDRLANLRWGTPRENNADKRQHGTQRQGEGVPVSKLTEADVRAIRASDGTQEQIAAMFGVTQSQVSRIQNRREWRHV